jgi:integrase
VPAPSEAAIKRYAAGLYTLESMRQDYRDALLFQLLCASRIREVVEMSWDEVDLEAGVWTLPAGRSKNKREHVVFLSAPASTILQRRHEWKAPNDTYVFPAPGDRKQALRVDLTQKALAENRKALGVGADFTSHRVRHAFTTWAAENGYPLDTVNRCTAHVTAVGINAHYNMAKLNNPARDLWKAWAEFLEQANG